MKKPKTLRKILRKVDRAALVAEIADLIKSEINAKKGLRGGALQKAYALALRLIKDIDKRAVNYLLDDVIVALEPHYAKYLRSGIADITNYFDQNKENIAKDLLDVVDYKASLLKNKILHKIYKTFRPRIEKEVIPAMPKLGLIIAKHQ